MRKTSLTVAALCGTLLWAGAAHAAPGGFPACQASLNRCESNLTTCDGNLATADSSLSTCTSNLSTCNTQLTTAQLCGNDKIDPGEQCDQSNLNGKTCVTQGFVGGTLKCGAGCSFDTSGCFTQAQRFTDNGDGTVTDHQTGLMWAKKTGTTNSASTTGVDDVNNVYTWSTGDNLADGTAFTSFLATLNNGASSDGGATTAITGCFANHCDWRLPSIVELRGIVDPSATGCSTPTGLCIDPTFGPTQSSNYWSATTVAGAPPDGVWVVNFSNGDVFGDLKATGNVFARAVRSGL
jgi:hypothetical protein